VKNKNKHQPATYKYSRNYSKAKLSELKEKLRTVDWASVYTSRSVDEKYNNFLKILRLNMDHVMPREPKKVSTAGSNIFWDNDILEQKANLQDAHNKYLLTGTEGDKERFHTMKRVYDQEVNRKRRQHTVDKIVQADNKTKVIWNIINNERKKSTAQQNHISLLNNDKLIHDPYHVSNIFNKLFAQPTMDHAIPPNTSSDQSGPERRVPALSSFKYISEYELEKLFSSIKPNNSAGFDEVTGKILKFCKDEVIKPIHHIINASLQQAIVPEKLKIAKIYPIYKKGDKLDPNNFRPISNLPVVSKLLERTVYNQLVAHLENNNLLSTCQHGFRKGHSTNTAIAHYVKL
jgi:hypothetical protein